MRHVENRLAAIAEATNQPEQSRNFAPVQRRRGFIHHEHVKIIGQRARDFDHLLVANAQRVDHSRRLNVQAEFFQQISRSLFGYARADESSSNDLATEENVLSDCELRDQPEFLADHADSGLLRFAR